MKTRYAFVTVVLVALLLGVVGLIAARGVHRGTGPPATASTSTPDEQVRGIEAQAEVGSSRSTTPEAAPAPDGRRLLKERCAQCHVVQLLESSRLGRTEWEKTLTRMETMGVHLSDAERSALLDFLAVPKDQ